MRFIVGISGGSGAILAYKTIQAIALLGHEIDLVISNAGFITLQHELTDLSCKNRQDFIASFPLEIQNKIYLHPIQNIGATIASGTYLTQGMVIAPCSMSTVAAIACGLSDNLLRRAADVMIKERRKLVIVARETPLSDIHLNNLLTLSRTGAIILPPMPAWYQHPKTLSDIEDHIVQKILDALGLEVPHNLRWQGLN